MKKHYENMQIAIDEAAAGFAKGEVPVGAAIFLNDRLLSKAHNCKESTKLATAHAELLAINEACLKIGDWRLEKTILYVTAEPCFMCAGAILQARIAEVVFGVPEPKFGAVISNGRIFDIPSLNHHPLYTGGVREEEIAALMKKFFQQIRDRK